MEDDPYGLSRAERQALKDVAAAAEAMTRGAEAQAQREAAARLEQEARAETTFTPSLNQRRRDWRPSSAPSGGRHSRLNVSTDMDRCQDSPFLCCC